MKAIKQFVHPLLGAVALLAASVVGAAGNLQAGASKSAFCVGCHGVDGNVTHVSARLAGQSVAGFQQGMMDFKTGKRFHPLMNILTQGLSEQDIRDLATFYAAQKPLDLNHASLYWRLGGPAAIDAAVNETISLSRVDPRLAGRVTGACAPKLKEQLCAATGGPCTYTGRDMKRAHAGLGVNAIEFGAVGENLVKVLTAFKVPEREQGELLGMIVPMAGDIVER